MLLVKLNVLKSLNKTLKYIFIYLMLNVASMSALAQEEAVQVGKHANTNLDAGSMIVSLLMVLALIIISAFILKKFKLSTETVSGMKVITSLSLGPKERLVVVEIQQQQVLLGVTAQQITLLKTLDEPMIVEKSASTSMKNSMNSTLLKYLTKQSENNDKK